MTPGATVWLTGLPGSGKTTLGTALVQAARQAGRCAVLLDGDELRRGLSRDLGFSPGDRSEHLRRTAEVARLLAEAGMLAVVAVVSPHAADRAHARALHAGLPFVEVHLDCPVDVCARRDPKGLYARALRGEVPAFTGVSAPYERPVAPDVVLPTSAEAVAESQARLVDALRDRGLWR